MPDTTGAGSGKVANTVRCVGLGNKELKHTVVGVVASVVLGVSSVTDAYTLTATLGLDITKG